MTQNGIQEWLEQLNKNYEHFTLLYNNVNIQPESIRELKRIKRSMKSSCKNYESILAQARMNGEEYLINEVMEAGKKIASYHTQLEEHEVKIAEYLDKIEAKLNVEVNTSTPQTDKEEPTMEEDKSIEEQQLNELKQINRRLSNVEEDTNSIKWDIGGIWFLTVVSFMLLFIFGGSKK